MELKQFFNYNVIEHMPDGYVAFDHDWLYTYVNGHAASLFGTTPEALLGKKYLECFPEAEGTRFCLAYQEVLRERHALHIEEYFLPWQRWFENHIDPTPYGIAIFFHDVTARKIDQTKIEETAAQLAEAQRLARLGSWKWLAQTGEMRCSEELYRRLERDQSSPIISLSDLMCCVAPEDQALLARLQDEAVCHLASWEAEYRIIPPREKRHGFIWERGEVLLDAEGKLQGLLAYVQDISSTRRAEVALQTHQRLMSLIIDALPINIYLKDSEGRYQLFNEEAARVTGISKWDAIGKTDVDLFSRELAEHIRGEDQYVMTTGEVTTREIDMPVHGQQRYTLAGRSRLQVKGGEESLLGFSIDITERRESEMRSEYLGNHDALTGLPNRNLLQDRLTHAIAHARRSTRMVAVLFLDLDRFKVINDSLGHKRGDELLCILADRLRHSLRESDTVARLSGDEFVMLLEGMESEGQVSFFAENLLSRIAETMRLGTQAVAATTSMGISVFPRDGDDPAALLKNADIAMYQAKKAGGNNFRFFDLEMNVQAMRRMLVESGLRMALAPESDGLSLYYQPIVELTSGRLIGMEALARWNHADSSISSPDYFIPVAEEVGLIVPLGEKLLRMACSQFHCWQSKWPSDAVLAFNLSARQLGSADLVPMIRSVLAETGMNPAQLQLGITETALMHSIDHARLLLHELAQMGIRLSIDDFGTGYSSLSYLKTLPIHKLKIDRSFVQDVVVDKDDAAIVNAIIAMAHSLELTVIAEGVETLEQRAFLNAQGCDEVQGYYFSRPLDSSAIEALLSRLPDCRLPL